MVASVPIVLIVVVDVAGGESVRNMSVLHVHVFFTRGRTYVARDL